MRIDETAYNEYANWKLDNNEFIIELEKNANDIYYRYKHILDVIEYFYDRLIDDENYTTDDDVIFKTGFYYIADQFEDLKDLLKKVYNNDLNELNKHAKEINLYLNTLDFQLEVLNNEEIEDNDIKRLLEFDQTVYDYLLNKQIIPDNLYEELSDLTEKIAKKLNLNYYSINGIFLEIADELDML